jgi:diadenosine tetraphosphate (Ap4A) HIT family hydrolase
MSTAIGEGFEGKYRKPDPFQLMWASPGKLKGALYVHERFMVRPDDTPVAPHHLLVIAREEKALEALDFAEYEAAWALARVVYAHMTTVLGPSRKVSLSVWGNQVETAHIHLVPRNKPTDATVWKAMDLTDAQRTAQLAQTCELLTFPPEVKAEADRVVNAALLGLQGVTLKPVLPGTPGA